jgi:hypothetical protein
MITQTQFPFQTLPIEGTNGINIFLLIIIIVLVALIIMGLCFLIKDSDTKKKEQSE